MDYNRIKRFGTRTAGGLGVKTLKKRTRTYHPMVTASDAEIREWNSKVKTRQVLRSVVKPWRYPHREWRTML